MRKFGALVALGLLVGSAQAADLKGELQLIYSRLAKASKTKDIAAMRKIFLLQGTRDFLYTDHKGRKQSATEMIDDTESMMKQVVSFIRADMHVDSIAAKGKTLEASVTSDWEMTLKGPNGKVHVVAGTEKQLDTWIYIRRGWKIFRMHIKSSKATLDGKPIPTD